MKISRDNITGRFFQKFDNPFLKLPIDKYMGLIPDPSTGKPQEAVPPQIALVNAVNCPDYRFIVAALSRRTGKTHISNIIGQLVVLVPGKQILIIAPNYSLSSISWDLQKNFLGLFDIETERKNAKDRIIELTNGSIIRIGSVAQVDSVVGRSYDLIIFDEAALNEDGGAAFNVQLRPTLDKTGSKCIFISTPRGKNWFHDFYLRGFSSEFNDWISIHATYKDNPRADVRDVEQARKQLSKAEFSQEYECDFVAMQGQIWELPAECIITVDLEDLRSRHCDVIAGLDLGFKDPTAMVVVYCDGTNFYIVAEYLKKENTTDAHGRAIRELVEEHGIDFIYIDSSAQQTRFDLAMNWDIPTVNANKAINDGIGYVSSLVEHGRVFVDKDCYNTLACFENYHWDLRPNLISEKPAHDEHSHIGDAIRYAIYTHAYNVEPV